MTITYRTAGDWGAGKGSNLTPEEVDENFWTLWLAVLAATANPPDPIDVASFSVSGTTFTVHLSNGATHGPFELPLVTFRWRGAWVPGIEYEAFDVFFVVDTGLYFVLREHVSAETFDENAESEDETDAPGGPLYHKMFGLFPGAATGPSRIVTNIAEVFYQPFDSDHGHYVRCNGPESTDTDTDPLAFEVRLGAAGDLSVGLEVTVRQTKPAVTLHFVAVEDTDDTVEIIGKDGYLNETGMLGATVTLKLVELEQDETDGNRAVWELHGDLAASP